MTIHVLLVLGLVLLLAWHTLARRFVFRSRNSLDRRAFLRMAAMSLAGVVVWRATEAAQAFLGLPGAKRRFTGSFETGSLTGTFPVVSWLLDAPPPIARDRWSLVIEGAVANRLVLDYAQVSALASDSVTVTIDCTGGWNSTQTFTGVKLGRLLDLATPRSTAASITVEAISGYGRRFSLEEARSCLLALQVAQQTLDHGHGFPARLVAPGQRGFNWVKWVTQITVNETSAIWQTPVPLQ